jgi:hypothetical protein
MGQGFSPAEHTVGQGFSPAEHTVGQGFSPAYRTTVAEAIASADSDAIDW